MIQYHSIKLKDGNLKFLNKDAKNIIALMPEGIYLVALISMNDKDPRDCQNRYFAILGEWSLSTGWTKDELHTLVKDELFGEIFVGDVSTSDLSASDWTIVFFQLESFLIKKFENK